MKLFDIKSTVNENTEPNSFGVQPPLQGWDLLNWLSKREGVLEHQIESLATNMQSILDHTPGIVVWNKYPGGANQIRANINAGNLLELSNESSDYALPNTPTNEKIAARYKELQARQTALYTVKQKVHEKLLRTRRALKKKGYA